MSYKKSLDVNYEEILQAQNDDSILIIDIREQSEIRKTGKLPGSIHIPSRVFILSINLEIPYIFFICRIIMCHIIME
jgi:rhodanese-related sulfurtransferase